MGMLFVNNCLALMQLMARVTLTIHLTTLTMVPIILLSVLAHSNQNLALAGSSTMTSNAVLALRISCNAHDLTVVRTGLHSPTIAVELRTRGLSALMLVLIHLKFDVSVPKKQKQKKQGWPQSKTSNAESFHNSSWYFSPKNKRSKF